MQMLTTGEEELLACDLELNDGLLAKHDAIASGSLMLAQTDNVRSQRSGTCTSSSLRPSEVKDFSPRNFTPEPNVKPGALVPTSNTSHIYEDDEEEDEFAQLARRHSKTRPVTSKNKTGGTNGELEIVYTCNPTSSMEILSSISSPSNALALPGPPAPVKD